MSRSRRRYLVIALILLLGISFTVTLSWLLQQWILQRQLAVLTRSGESWGRRLAQELDADDKLLSTIGTFLGQVDVVTQELFEASRRNITADSLIESLAWAPEVSSKNFSDIQTRYRELGIDWGDLPLQLSSSEKGFPIVFSWGRSNLLTPGTNVKAVATLEKPLLEALQDASPAYTVVPGSDGEGYLNIVSPVVERDGHEIGVLIAELNFTKLVKVMDDNFSEPLAVQIYSDMEESSEASLVWASSTQVQPDSFVVAVPFAAGAKLWVARFYAVDKPELVSWEAALAGALGLAFTLSMVLMVRASELEALFHEKTAARSERSLKEKELAYRESMVRLAKAEGRYRHLFEKSRAMIWIHDQDGVILNVNPASAESLGYEINEMKGRNLRDFIIPTERYAFEQYLQRSLGAEGSKGLLKLYAKSGATRFWMYQTNLSQEASGVMIRCYALDVTESQQVERELERLARSNQLILESVGEGIYGVNLAGECSFINPAALNFTGYTREDLNQDISTMHEILQPMRDDGIPYPWSESAVYHTLYDGEVRRVKEEWMWRKDGTKFLVDYVVSPIVVEGGRISGAVVTFQDVTERCAIERMKNEFISIVSHELRTPLTSIRGSLGLLASGLLKKFPEKADKMLGIAVENTDRLVRLINDILDIERLESGQVNIEQKPYQLAVLMTGAQETMQAMANSSSVNLVVDPFQAQVWVDPDRCLQVLTNLLSNAIKFSIDGGEVKLAAESYKDEGRQWVRVSVKDSGRGIPASAKEKVFERFGQVDASDSREKGGTGLGLPICKMIIEQHGGKIWLESKVGEGSTFFFTLPTPPDKGSD